MLEYFKKAVTVRDSAESLNISAVTVSRALTNHPEVSEETKQKVLSRARKMSCLPPISKDAGSPATGAALRK